MMDFLLGIFTGVSVASWAWSKWAKIKRGLYDPTTDTYLIGGMKYTDQALRLLRDESNAGKIFKLVRVEGHIITIQTITDEKELAQRAIEELMNEMK